MGVSSILYRGVGYHTTTMAAIGSQDFTLEYWFSRNNTSSGEVYSMFSVGAGGAAGGFHVRMSSNKVEFWIGANATATITSTITYGDTNWHHLAISRTGTTTRLYIDGAQVNTTTALGSITATALYIGGYGGTSDLNALRSNIFMEEFRLTVGTGRYTTTPFTLQDWPYSVPDVPVFSTTSFMAPSGTAVTWPLVVTTTTGRPLTYAVQSGTLPSGFTLNSSTGVISGTLATNAGSYDIVTNVTIRASDGFAYTDQVVSLINQTVDSNWNSVTLYMPNNGLPGTIAVDSSSALRTNTGQGTGGTIVSVTPKWYASALQPQSGNFPKFTNSGSLSMAGDFTVEGWFYPTAYQTTSGISALFGSYIAPLTANDAFLLMNGTGLVGLYVNGTATTGGSAAALNTWHHIAWSRTSGVNSIYLNGTRITQPTYTGTLGDTTNQAITVGGYEAATANNFIGFIQELRVTAGVGRYSGTTLTVPTGPYPRMASAAQSVSWISPTGSIGGATFNKSFAYQLNAQPSAGNSGTAITYSVQSGSLPTGVSLNTSTGLISGSPTDSVISDTVYSFTIRATSGSVFSDRAFTMQVWNDDALYSNVFTAFQFIGANGAAPVENSGKSTFARSNATLSTAQFKWLTSSAFLNGVSNFYTVTPTTTGQFNGDFTIETWIRPTSAGTTSSTGYFFSAAAATNDIHSLNIGLVGNNMTANWLGGSLTSTGNLVTYNTWHHLAAVRQNGVLTLYVNGVSVASGAYTGQPTTSASPFTYTIGCLKSLTSTYNLNAYLNDYRVTFGARYTGSSFTVPTFQIPLH